MLPDTFCSTNICMMRHSSSPLHRILRQENQNTPVLLLLQTRRLHLNTGLQFTRRQVVTFQQLILRLVALENRVASQ